MKHDSASETVPTLELNSVIRMTGLPLTATEQTVAEMFPGIVFLLLFLI